MVHDDDRQLVLSGLTGSILRASQDRAGPAPTGIDDPLDAFEEWKQEVRKIECNIIEAIVKSAVEILDKDK